MQRRPQSEESAALPALVFVDKRDRRPGVARAALAGSLAQIASAGGGLVEAISEITSGRGPGPVPVQLNRRTVRGLRFLPNPAGRQARLDREQDDRAGVTDGSGG